MPRIRRCDNRCHKALGTRCKCWCGGYYHGSIGDGPANREKLEQVTAFLQEHGGKEGQVYIDQLRLPL